MEIHQAIKEFQTTSKELKKTPRRKILLNVLKLILIGFFVGRDTERRVHELALKRSKILESISARDSLIFGR